MMTTLHIEHPITSFEVWKEAFDRFAEVRQQCGVRHHHIRQPVDDPRYVVIDLEFDTADEAQRFLGFLQTNVWSRPENSPGLDGVPLARIIEARPDE